MKASDGFTLVEVLIAFLLATVGIFGLLSVFVQAHASSKASGHTTVLNLLAAEKAEELRALDYDDADLSLGIHPDAGTDSQGRKYYPITGWSEEHSLRWQVLVGPTDGNGTPETGIKTVVIEATFATRYDTGGDPLPGGLGPVVVYRTFLAE